MYRETDGGMCLLREMKEKKKMKMRKRKKKRETEREEGFTAAEIRRSVIMLRSECMALRDERFFNMTNKSCF